MAQYFFERYKIELEPNQELIIVNKPWGRIYLPTELCQEASLPKNFTDDRNDQQKIQ